jgi:hypothetical protein
MQLMEKVNPAKGGAAVFDDLRGPGGQLLGKKLQV